MIIFNSHNPGLKKKPVVKTITHDCVIRLRIWVAQSFHHDFRLLIYSFRFLFFMHAFVTITDKTLSSSTNYVKTAKMQITQAGL